MRFDRENQGNFRFEVWWTPYYVNTYMHYLLPQEPARLKFFEIFRSIFKQTKNLVLTSLKGCKTSIMKVT